MRPDLSSKEFQSNIYFCNYNFQGLSFIQKQPINPMNIELIINKIVIHNVSTEPWLSRQPYLRVEISG